MERHMVVFTGVMLLLSISLVVAFCILAIWTRRKFQFKSEETLPVLAKRLSVIPFAFNLVVLITALSSFLSVSISPALGLLFLFLVILLIGISITIGTSTGLLGIVCSVVFTGRGAKRGVRYIIVSSLSTMLSLGFLALYLFLILA